MPTAKKKEIVNKLVERIKPAQAVVFTDFTGLTTAEVEKLRNQLAEQNAYFNIVKNTLLNIAFQKSGFPHPSSDILSGPTATLSCQDNPLASIKLLYEFAQTTDNLKIKGGFFDKKSLTVAQIIDLAKLPTKLELFSSLIRNVQAPAYNLVYVLQANIVNLASVIKQVKDQIE